MESVNNILSTRLNLWQRKIVEDPKCPICQPKKDSVIHSLWSYPTTTNVWDDKYSFVNKWPSGGRDFVHLWLDMCKRIEKQNLGVVVIILYMAQKE